MTMAAEKAQALVLRTTDWSETSRIATLWTREFGKVRVLAKGGRRLKSSFESALDLLTVCSIVLIRKSSGGLDLLTEAQVVRRFPRLAADLQALYGAYYLAELLSDGTQDHDPHPGLYDLALATLEELGGSAALDPWLVMHFEARWLVELGVSPILDNCIDCGNSDFLTEGQQGRVAFSVAAGGVACRNCQGKHGDRRPVSIVALDVWRLLASTDETWREKIGQAGAEVRRLLGQYVTYHLGRRPRMLSYLESRPG